MAPRKVRRSVVVRIVGSGIVPDNPNPFFVRIFGFSMTVARTATRLGQPRCRLEKNRLARIHVF
jgi:hypothetical protein